jgi:hypothetical protein
MNTDAILWLTPWTILEDIEAISSVPPSTIFLHSDAIFGCQSGHF